MPLPSSCCLASTRFHHLDMGLRFFFSLSNTYRYLLVEHFPVFSSSFPDFPGKSCSLFQFFLENRAFFQETLEREPKFWKKSGKTREGTGTGENWKLGAADISRAVEDRKRSGNMKEEH